MSNSIYDSEVIYKYLSFLKLEEYFRRLVLRHIVSILLSVFMAGYKGKTVQMSANSEKCRTTVIMGNGTTIYWSEFSEERLYAESMRKQSVRANQSFALWMIRYPQRQSLRHSLKSKLCATSQKNFQSLPFHPFSYAIAGTAAQK